jgi:hypothetical protein
MIIPAASRTPEVVFTAQRCTVKGECYPEDISEFSAPIMDQLSTDLAATDAYQVDIELYYFNSSSAKFLFDLFEFLDQSAAEGKQIAVIWRYRADDDTMQDAGEEFREDLEHLVFKLQQVD